MFICFYLLVVGMALTHWPLGDFTENIEERFKKKLVINGWGIFCENALRWMSLGLTDDESTLDRVMAWCHQATSHYLSPCWPRSVLPYGVTRTQWVNTLRTNSQQFLYLFYFSSSCTPVDAKRVRHEPHFCEVRRWPEHVLHRRHCDCPSWRGWA